MIRVGVSPEAFPTRAGREQTFAEVGHGIYRSIRSGVPHRDGQAVLDFGCGSGRVLRWFTTEPGLRLTACDIHHASIDWMQTNFPSDVRLYANEPPSPLPETDDTFDLIYCGSVFSHLTDWAPLAARALADSQAWGGPRGELPRPWILAGRLSRSAWGAMGRGRHRCDPSRR